MNIIYSRISGYDWVSVPSDAVARELEKLGHDITIIENISYIPPKKYDFVWSPYESVTILGDAISKRLNIPHFSHIEVLPPWRVIPNADYDNYGIIDKNDTEVTNFNISRPYYLDVGNAWKNATIKTISNPVRLPMHQKLFPDLENVKIRFPSIDVATIEAAKKMYSPKKISNRIITIARATQIKRYDLLLNVMNHVKNEIEWVIIGEGPMTDKIKTQLTNQNVKLIMLGPLWGWNRFYEIMKAKLMIYAMGGMPPIEAALLDVFPIVIENQPTRDIPEFDKFMYYNFKDSMPIFKHNQDKEMAQMVDERIEKTAEESLNEYDTVNKFMSGKTGVTPSSVNAKNIIELFNNENL